MTVETAKPARPMTRSQRYRRVMESLIIRDEHRNLVPMRFSQSQELIWEKIAPVIDRHEPLRFICLKSRQIYSSTLFQALMFSHTIANYGVHSLVIAHDVPTAHELLDMAKRFNDHLPMPALAPPKTSELIFPFPNGASRYRVQSAKVTGKGRGANWTCAHLSECAYYPNPEIPVGVRQAVPDLPDTLWAIESTANGKMGIGEYFYGQWLAATAGDSDLVPIFVPPYAMPKYRRTPAILKDDWDDAERNIAAAFGVDGEFLAWRRYAIRSKCKGSVDIFNQEYPLTPELAFISSGIPAFDQDALLRLHKDVREPLMQGEMRSGQFTRIPKGVVRIWKEPQPNTPYVIGADTAEGIASESTKAKDARDYAAAVVIDMRTLEQVASVHGHIRPWDFAELLNGLGRWYGDALLAVEINNHGHSVQDRLLREFHYPNLHHWLGKPDRHPKPGGHRIYGWETNSYSRPLMIDAGRRVINSGQLTVHEAKLIEEAQNFSMMDNGKYEAEYGHDDRIVALLIALRSREENYTEAKLPPVVSEPDFRGIRIVDHRDVFRDASKRSDRIFSRVREAVTSYLQL